VDLLQPIVNYGGHWLIPFAIAAILWRDRWIKVGLVIAAANLIDLDHLLADPIFDPNRCSIGFHLLHGWEAAIVYAVMIAMPKWWVRVLGLGGLWHVTVDSIDCAMQAI